jgi:hypothetical protein
VICSLQIIPHTISILISHSHDKQPSKKEQHFWLALIPAVKVVCDKFKCTSIRYSTSSTVLKTKYTLKAFDHENKTKRIYTTHSTFWYILPSGATCLLRQIYIYIGMNPKLFTQTPKPDQIYGAAQIHKETSDSGGVIKSPVHFLWLIATHQSPPHQNRKSFKFGATITA